jgi:hypothetical protein
MNGWALGGLLCIIYTLAVGGLALKRSPGLLKIVKMKLGKNMSDETARKVTLVFAGIVGVAGIVFFILAATL